MAKIDDENIAFDVECFYWDERVKTCRAYAGGLFLPVAEYVRKYCASELHPSCEHYHDFVQQQVGEAACKNDERRKFARAVGKYPFVINWLFCNSQARQAVHVQASTIDFGLGGVRFEADQLLPVDALVEFSMAGSYSNLITSGVGRVRWCRHKKASRLYQVGIAFEDKETVDSIRSELSLARS